MNREQQAAALARAMAMIGTERKVCAHCQQPLGEKSYADPLHTPRSAALECGLDPQTVYRTIRNAKRGAA